MKKHKVILSWIYVAIIILAGITSYQSSIGNVINKDKALFISVDEFTPSFTKHRIKKGEVGIQTYYGYFSSEDLKRLNDNTYILILNKLTDNAIAVYVNDTKVLVQGDMQKGNSNLKNSLCYAIIDSGLIQESNEIKIEGYANYKSGTESDDIIITNTEDGFKAITHLNNVGNDIILISIGFLIFSSIFLVIIYCISNSRDISFIYCALATLFFSVFFHDYLKAHSLIGSFLINKKIHLMSLYIGTTFYMLSLSRFLSNKFIKYSTFTLLFVFTMVTFLSPDMITYKSYYNLLYIVYLLNLAVATIFSVIKIRSNEYAYIFVVAFLSSGIFATISIMLELTGNRFSIDSPIVYMVTLAVLPLILGIDHIVIVEKEVVKEKLLREQEFIKANTDGLTGAWNQRYLFKQLSTVKDNAVIALMDLDDFKIVNDRYGHLAGDQVLIKISEHILKNINEKDVFCRYGGDEFVLLISQDNLEEAKIGMEKLCNEINEMYVHYNDQKIHVTVSIGVHLWDGKGDYKNAIENADAALYNSKHAGKNTVIVHGVN